MKRFKWMLAIVCLAGLYSCQQKVNARKSFAEIIKEDPSRKTELIDLAKQFRDTSENSKYALDPLDIMSGAELSKFRSKAGYDESGDKKFPEFIVSANDIMAVINGNFEITDSLVFYKGKYSHDNQHRIDRYNAKFRKGQKPYDATTFKNRKTFAIQLKTYKSSANDTSFAQSPVYDLGRLCPPPKTGCN